MTDVERSFLSSGLTQPEPVSIVATRRFGKRSNRSSASSDAIVSWIGLADSSRFSVGMRNDSVSPDSPQIRSYAAYPESPPWIASATPDSFRRPQTFTDVTPWVWASLRKYAMLTSLDPLRAYVEFFDFSVWTYGRYLSCGSRPETLNS